MNEMSDDQAAASAKASLYWVARRAAVALGGAFALMVLGVATGSTLISLAALGFPFAVWVGVIVRNQELGGKHTMITAPIEDVAGIEGFVGILDDAHSRRVNEERV